MATDKTFHHWARLVPDTVARLAGVEPHAHFEWSSVTLKSMERRLDGILRPLDAGTPLIFVELQGYPDARFLRRWLQGIVAYLDEAGEIGDITGLVIYLQASHEAESSLDLGWRGRRLLRFEPQVLVLGETAPEVLLEAGDAALVPLLPLSAVPAADLPHRAPGWARQLRDAGFPEALEKDLLGLLGAFLAHRMPRLGLRALEQILGGRQMEDTLAGQELIEKGIEKGIERGIERGIEQGIEQGIEKGRLEGARELLKHMAARRFGSTPAWLESWAAGQTMLEGLERGSELLFEAQTPEQLRQLLGA